MRKGFERLSSTDDRHNEVHRKAYKIPYLTKFVSSAPTADELDSGEFVYCTADDKLYTKLEDGTIKKSGAFS